MNKCLSYKLYSYSLTVCFCSVISSSGSLHPNHKKKKHFPSYPHWYVAMQTVCVSCWDFEISASESVNGREWSFICGAQSTKSHLKTLDINVTHLSKKSMSRLIWIFHCQHYFLLNVKTLHSEVCGQKEMCSVFTISIFYLLTRCWAKIFWSQVLESFIFINGA